MSSTAAPEAPQTSLPPQQASPPPPRRSNVVNLSDVDRSRIRAQIIASHCWPEQLAVVWGIGIETAAAMIRTVRSTSVTTTVTPTPPGAQQAPPTNAVQSQQAGISPAVSHKVSA